MKDGEKYRSSKYGGFATLLMGVTAMYFAGLLLFYQGDSSFESMNHIRRRLQATLPSTIQGNDNKTLANNSTTPKTQDNDTTSTTTTTPKKSSEKVKVDDTYYSQENFWWKSYETKPMNRSEYKEPFNIKDANLGKVSLVF